MTVGAERGPEVLAAVDLGSNSFHMIVARSAGGGIEVIERLRERVGLAEGLDAAGWLDDAAQARALACLESFGRRLREVPPANVRAVGTSTFRAARNARGLRARAQAALGHPIEVLSGLEEARLIYLGAAHGLGEAGGRRLVVDVGGGSTELILGEGFSSLRADSLLIGHLGLRGRFFADGSITRDRMSSARRAALGELEPVERAYRRIGWSTVVGSSGTARAVDSILRESGWSTSGITGDGLALIEEHMIEAGRDQDLAISGLEDERKPVIAGGVALLQAVMEALHIERMDVTDWALREGVLYDLLERQQEHDVRGRTLEDLHAEQRRWREGGYRLPAPHGGDPGLRDS